MDQETTTREPIEEAPIAHPRRCASCGGLNPPAALWCGQCHNRFEEPQAKRASRSETKAPVAATASHVPAEDAPASDLPIDPESTFQVTDQGIRWTCSVCETVNGLEHSICDVCGAPFARTVLPPDEKPQRDPNMTAMISLFLPGAGHAYLGMWGQAIARGVISLWVLLVVVVAAFQRGAASSNVILVTFGLASIMLWGVTAHDAYREARDERTLVVMKGKIFLYTVLGLLLMLVAIVMSAMMKAQSG
jgi:hypothetical protein